jgi:AcrR family transcriptional regulator
VTANTPSNRPRGRPALPLDRILGAALELVDEQGADALSMRSLAQRLNSGTATLYRHFGSRSELVALVVDRMIGETDMPPVGSFPWQETCISFAQRMFDALGRHGNMALLLIGHVPMGPNALARRELFLSVLVENGFAPAVAAHAYATLSRYVLGLAIQASSASDGAQQDAELAARFHQLDPARYPATVAAADALPVSLQEEFAFGLRLIVAGLEWLSASPQSK